MKKQNLVLWSVLMTILLSVSSILAQDKKMDMKPMPAGEMKMSDMSKGPHHMLMMAYHHNAVAFTRVLLDMTSDGKIENVDLARAAFAEIKRSVDKMEEIQKSHMSSMGKMDAAMTEKMKPMMEKMEAEKAALKGHVLALEKALQANAPNASDVEMHAAVLLLKFENMNKPEKKMEM